MRRALVITNAEAGSSDERSVDEAVRALRDGGLDVVVEATSEPAELVGVLSRRDGREVVVAGGDGSLHAVVAALQARAELAASVVALIPLGTGNDFARGVGIPLEPAAAAAVVVRDERRPIDVLDDDAGGIVVNAVHVGVGAEAGREAQPWKQRFGKVGYVIGAVKAGIRTQGHRLRVVADGTVLADGHHRVLQVGIGNGAFVGGGTPLTPEADPHDGNVDVVVSFAVSPVDRLLYGVHLKRGTHDQRDDVRVVRARSVEVTGRGFWCNADGELKGPVDRCMWTVRPAAFTMLLPDSSD